MKRKEREKMPAYKNKENGSWYVSAYYKNWKGEQTRKVKRGFATKRDALEWERNFLSQHSDNLDMSFENFVEIYKNDMKERLKLNTWNGKISIIEQKIMPYFKEKKMNEIKPTDVRSWQNEMMSYRNKNGEGYSQTYLKSLHNQLSAIFNHAVKYYELKNNPAAKAGNMGKKESEKEMLYTLVGDVYLPNLVTNETNYKIGFWGQRHKEYLKENHRVIYFNLLTSSKLNSHLHDIDFKAKEMYDDLIHQLAEKQGITEKLKVENQMLWVRKMNNIANQAREIVNKEIIYK